MQVINPGQIIAMTVIQWLISVWSLNLVIWLSWPDRSDTIKIRPVRSIILRRPVMPVLLMKQLSFCPKKALKWGPVIQLINFVYDGPSNQIDRGSAMAWLYQMEDGHPIDVIKFAIFFGVYKGIFLDGVYTNVLFYWRIMIFLYLSQ